MDTSPIVIAQRYIQRPRNLLRNYLYHLRGGRVIGISGSLIWSKTLVELIFNPCGEFRWGPEETAKSTFLTSTLVPWDLFRSFKVCSDAKESGVWKAMGSYCTYPIPGKSAVLGSVSLPWKTCLWHNCSLRFLHLQWKNCPWAEHSDADDDGNITV